MECIPLPIMESTKVEIEGNTEKKEDTLKDIYNEDEMNIVQVKGAEDNDRMESLVFLVSKRHPIVTVVDVDQLGIATTFL